MQSLKKFLTLALAGALALALLTGCGSDKSSATHKSVADAMADYAKGAENNQNITYTVSSELDSKLKSFSAEQLSTVAKAVYNNPLTDADKQKISTALASLTNNKVVYLYCGKYDTDAGKQAIYLNAHYYCTTPKSKSFANDRQIGLITTSFTDGSGQTVKVRFAVVVSEVPGAAKP